ncbi:heavy metal translocating P-type ATPase [Undibacterium sp. TJN19]|uniref:heavy metal translocating P-type ATPase n=1 Tax=Undibacterium sp. TJN19 TaxID=3413055 RepID=UPI003BF36500
MSEKTSCCGHQHHGHADQPSGHDGHTHSEGGNHEHAHKPVHEHDHEHDHKHDHQHNHQHAHTAASKPAIALPAHAESLKLRIAAMDCPTEEALIRKALASQAGILALDFDLLNRILTVHHEQADLAEIQRRLSGTGMQGIVINANNDASDEAGRIDVVATSPAWLRHGRVILGGVCAIAAELLAWYSGNETSVLVAVLALTTIVSSGIPTLKKGWIALRHFTLNIHLLMTAAVIGATAIGQWPEAAMVIWLFAIAELIEAASLTRARDIISGLRTQAPETSLLQQPDGSWLTVDTGKVEVGQRIQIRPGDRISLDGVIEAGSSSINEAAITGESMPVEKQSGDLVYAGSLNQTGLLQLRVTAAQASTMLARIATSIQEAQSQRAPTQRFVDRFAAIYTPAVFAVAVLVAILPPLLWQHGWHDSLYRALVLLVIACPCALVISTPVTIVSGLAAAARRGIVVKGGVYLEQGHALKIIALDKTGTLTEGKPQLTSIVSLSDKLEEDILQLAASLDAHSSHPLALALLNACKRPLLATDDVSLFELERGRGMTGKIAGQSYQLGNRAMLTVIQASGADNQGMEAHLQRLEAAANTVLFLCENGRLLGLLAMADKVRKDSQAAVAKLQGMGIKTVMLTGDNPQTASAVAAQTGISEFHSQMLPTEKLQAIEGYTEQGITGMCGDGINDAPALARAHIGFAMAAGSDTALETADVAFMQNDLRKLAEFVQISRHASAILKQNIAFALLVKFVFFGLAFSGHASLWMAVFADAGTSVLVVLNGLRLLRTRAG